MHLYDVHIILTRQPTTRRSCFMRGDQNYAADGRDWSFVPKRSFLWAGQEPVTIFIDFFRPLQCHVTESMLLYPRHCNAMQDGTRSRNHSFGCNCNVLGSGRFSAVWGRGESGDGYQLIWLRGTGCD